MRTGPPTNRDMQVDLFGAALFLSLFTAESLADYAHAGVDAARAFLEEECAGGLIELISPGRSPTSLYRVRTERRDELLQRLAEHRREQSGSSVTGYHARPANRDADDYSPITLLESTLAALAENERESADDRQELIDQANIRFRGAKADLGALIADGVELSEIHQLVARLMSAKENLAIALIPPDPPSEISNLVPDDFIQFLRDWTAPIKILMPRDKRLKLFATHSPAEFIDFTLRRAAIRSGTSSAIFEPAYHLLQRKEMFDLDISDLIVQQVRQRILALSSASEPFAVTALSVIAAVFEIREAAEPLMAALLLSGIAGRMLAQHRRVCLMAVAHLARPRHAIRDPQILSVASVCHYLLLRAGGLDTDLDILTPAALQAPGVDAGELLHRLGESMFTRSGMKPDWRARTDEGSLMRNLALATHAPGFPLLQDHLSDLLEESYGRTLIARLSAPEHEALDLTDANGSSSFIVRLGKRVTSYLNLSKPSTAPLVLTDRAADRLSHLLTSRTWDRRSRGGAQLQTTFSAQLGRRAANRVISLSGTG
jgi:hypothetical protein